MRSNEDPLSEEFDALARRVRALQRKRFFATALAMTIATIVIVVGEVLVFSIPFSTHRHQRIPLMLAMLPLIMGIATGNSLRSRLSPKEPPI